MRKNSLNYFGDRNKNVVGIITRPQNVDSVPRWLCDRDGEIRYAFGLIKAEQLLFRRASDGKWTPIKIDFERDTPLAVDTDSAVLLIAHLNDEGSCELRRFDTRNNSLGPVLYTDEKYDFSDGRLHFSPDGREPVSLTYAQQAPTRFWFRAADQALQATIDSALPPDRLNHITSRSRDGQKLLVTSGSDRHPGTLYFIDLAAHKVRKIADLAPWLPERLLAPVRLMSFRTRDGLTLDGYVTLPQNYVEGKPAPTVVLPHGGPWARDVWGYEPWSQFLASRGYVVFRPNYRGSSGYNAALSLAPAMEFRKMHDDVTDGVRALVAAKISDPAHLAIFGASFGGYLAMSGAAFEPDLYKCAITFAGVFDWAELMQQDKDNGNEYRYAWLRRDFGDPEKDRAKFDAMSPLQAVANVRIPIFVAHGKEDRNADTDQSRSLVRALKKAGVPHEAWFIPDEAHGLSELAHRTELFTRVEAFLKKHL
ncbi:MAG: S9 family peptidase [Candidatus Didemnitutus sp.]|nr:S9 family peptidase [Candidatus Didemnitutus sp.]